MCSHHARMLGRDARGIVGGPGAGVDLLTTAANEGDGNVRFWRQNNKPCDGWEVVHDGAASHGAVERALREVGGHVLWPGRHEMHADADQVMYDTGKVQK